MKSILHRLLWQIRNPHFFYGIKKYELIVLDDYFPNPVSGFRTCEFFEILKTIFSTKILINPIAYKYYGLTNSDFEAHLRNFKHNHPDFNDKIRMVSKWNNVNTKLFYFVFLNNGRRIVPYLNRSKINFIFTLYPGGGFRMNDRQSDYDLQKIMSSVYFKGVIVNQQCIKDYLLKKNFCPEQEIHYIHGIPMSQDKLQFDAANKKYYAEKDHLDICFAAAKNLPQGNDKGYDLFIEAAIQIYATHKNVRFHVIGGFSEKEIDVVELSTAIQFYGYINAHELPEVLRRFDIILSPNRPGMLGAGSFDGFPLGTCVEASLVGCVIIATDELNENNHYIENEEIIIIKPDAKDIIDKIESLIALPSKIKQIGISGMKRTKELYSYKNQIEPRLKLLKSFINRE